MKHERARRIMQAVLTIAEAVRDEREECAADPGRDAIALAGCLAGELAAHGGQIEDANVHRLKWPIDEAPRPIDDPEGLLGAVGLSTALLRALELGRVRGGGVRGRVPPQVALERAAKVWPAHRNKGDADAAMTLVEKKIADDLAADRVAAHAARLNAPASVVKPARVPLPPKAAARMTEDMWNISDDLDLAGVG